MYNMHQRLRNRATNANDRIAPEKRSARNLQERTQRTIKSKSNRERGMRPFQPIALFAKPQKSNVNESPAIASYGCVSDCPPSFCGGGHDCLPKHRPNFPGSPLTAKRAQQRPFPSFFSRKPVKGNSRPSGYPPKSAATNRRSRRLELFLELP